MNNKLINNKKLINEWNYNKNVDINIESLTNNSNKKVWWKCCKGHEWQAVVASRTAGAGCPYCSGHKILPGYNDLCTLNKKLSKEWDYSRNEKKPCNMSPNSHDKVWWICSECGHKWNAEIKSRNQGTGCPICGLKKLANSQKRISLLKAGSLLETNPKLAKEWNYSKNEKLTPNDITAGSNKKVWWKCRKGHEWQALISSRNNGVGCPYCAQETQTSFAEQAIYYYLKKIFKNVKNRYVINNQEIDIYISDYNIGVEYDGARFHNNLKSIEREQKKFSCLKSQGITLIRIREYYEQKYNNNSADYYLGYSNGNKNNNLNNIMNDLIEVLNKICHKEFTFDINIDRDRNKIYQLYIFSEKENSLETLKPKVAKYWNYKKNGILTPDKVPAGSSKRVWWKCDKGHEWQAIISSRNERSGCPYCLNQKVQIGFNDLLTTNNKLAKEWNYERNHSLKPTEITAGSNRKVWWKCQKCNYEWQAVVSSRNLGNGCPECSKKIMSDKQKKLALKNNGSLFDNYPILLHEWNYDKNKIDPKTITSSAKIKVFWKCSKCGYEWNAWIADRTQGKGCPKCGKQKVSEAQKKLALKKSGSLQKNNPLLSSEWNYEKNNNLKPTEITAGSNKKVWWKCRKGHEWKAVIASRNNGAGCPVCTNHLKRKVIQFDKLNNIINKYDSIGNASKSTGIHTTSISNVCKGDAKTAGGYIWKYDNDEK